MYMYRDNSVESESALGGEQAIGDCCRFERHRRSLGIDDDVNIHTGSVLCLPCPLPSSADCSTSGQESDDGFVDL
jgi:hypothetical protein